MCRLVRLKRRGGLERRACGSLVSHATILCPKTAMKLGRIRPETHRLLQVRERRGSYAEPAIDCGA